LVSYFVEKIISRLLYFIIHKNAILTENKIKGRFSLLASYKNQKFLSIFGAKIFNLIQLSIGKIQNFIHALLIALFRNNIVGEKNCILRLSWI
jgi:hypothetical protein